MNIIILQLKADYTTHYSIRFKTAFAQVKANGKSKTKSCYQSVHAKMTIDNNRISNSLHYL